MELLIGSIMKLVQLISLISQIILSHVSGGSECGCRTQVWWGGFHCSSDWVSAGQSGTNTWMPKS